MHEKHNSLQGNFHVLCELTLFFIHYCSLRLNSTGEVDKRGKKNHCNHYVSDEMRNGTASNLWGLLLKATILNGLLTLHPQCSFNWSPLNQLKVSIFDASFSCSLTASGRVECSAHLIYYLQLFYLIITRHWHVERRLPKVAKEWTLCITMNSSFWLANWLITHEVRI